MALEKLTIKYEEKDAVGEYNGSLSALFNPDKLVYSKSVNWKRQEAVQRDCPELDFLNGQPITLKLDLIFDTYDPEDGQNKDQDVRKLYTNQIFHLTTVENHGGKHRPPVCRLFWGKADRLFQGVLEQLEQQFILFTEDGVPVRAKLSCTFTEWRTNKEDAQRQNTESSDVAKMHVVKAGDTLCSIAAKEYRDPALWRPIAIENGLDDPRVLTPGTVLLLPTLTDRSVSS